MPQMYANLFTIKEKLAFFHKKREKKFEYVMKIALLPLSPLS